MISGEVEVEQGLAPPNTLWVISGAGFTSQMIPPTVSKH